MLADLTYPEYSDLRDLYSESPWGPYVDSMNQARIARGFGRRFGDEFTTTEDLRVKFVKSKDPNEPTEEEVVQFLDTFNRDQGSMSMSEFFQSEKERRGENG